jgi:hypothetical protein
MMWHKAWAQPSKSGVGWPHLHGRLARYWRHFNFHFANVSRRVSARGIRCPKSVEAKLGGLLAMCMADRLGFGELPP